MLPRKPKISYRYLKSGIEEFHRKYAMVPADKAANNVVVVWRLHYINTLKQELSDTKAYEQTSEKEKSVTNNHIFHNATRFAVSVYEDQERKQLFTWLSLVVSLMASFVLSFFPLDVLDEIWDLIESVSEGFLTYSSYIRLAT